MQDAALDLAEKNGVIAAIKSSMQGAVQPGHRSGDEWSTAGFTARISEIIEVILGLISPASEPVGETLLVFSEQIDPETTGGLDQAMGVVSLLDADQNQGRLERD